MGWLRIGYIYSALILWMVCITGVALADDAAVEKPPVIQMLEAETNGPCVDVTSSEPYGFPLTVECPFAVDRKLLDEAVEMAKSASSAGIVRARAGHLSHPGWRPGVVFFYESYRTNQQSLSSCLYVYFNNAEEKREPGKASCGRDLVSISAAALRSSLRVDTNEVINVSGDDVVVHISCVSNEVRVIDGTNRIYVVDVQLEDEIRGEIKSLLQSLNADKYLEAGGYYEIETIAGNVYPGEDEREIVPAALAETAFARPEGNDVTVDDEPQVESIRYFREPLLHRGRWDVSLNDCSIQYHADTKAIDIRHSSGKYSEAQSSFLRLDGVWVKKCEAMICH